MSASMRRVDERVMEPNDLPNLNSREGASCTLWCIKFRINLNSRERVMSFMYENVRSVWCICHSCTSIICGKFSVYDDMIATSSKKVYMTV